MLLPAEGSLGGSSYVADAKTGTEKNELYEGVKDPDEHSWNSVYGILS